MILSTQHLNKQRRGVVLIVVLIVIVVLSLAAYQYNDLITAEYVASYNSHRAAQARAIADSGVHFTAAMVSDPNNIANLLNGNPYSSDYLTEIAVPGDNDKTKNIPGGRFRLVAPNQTDPRSYRSGVVDEGGKINPNALMKQDPSGELLFNVLNKMTIPVDNWHDIAAAIVDWIDADSTPRQGGTENEYYSAKNPSYRCKNGPLDSIEELLLVKGIDDDPWILYGDDTNRNGVQDDDEQPRSGEFFPGLAAFLTVHSRETNLDTEGKALANINGDLSGDLYPYLSDSLGDDLAKFLVLYRQYGPANSSGAQQSLGSSIASLISAKPVAPPNTTTRQGKLADYTPNLKKSTKQKIKSIFELVDVQVSVQTSEKQGEQNVNITTIYTSPLNDVAQRRELMPKLFTYTSIFETTEIPARINVNTAPREVLMGIPELTEADVENIIKNRPSLDTPDKPGEIYQTPTWLLTEAELKTATLKKIENYITTKAQVYRVQVIGTLDTTPPASARVEAVIDANNGRPRILSWRDLGDWGLGMPANMR